MMRKDERSGMFWTEFLHNNLAHPVRRIAVGNMLNYKNNIINAVRNLTFYGLLRNITGNGKYLGTTPKIKNH